VKERKETLCSISRYLVADAWFSKKPFVDQIIALDMHLISRLRDDADLKYLYQGPSTGKRGRPCKYAGKIDSANIDTSYFELIEAKPGVNRVFSHCLLQVTKTKYPTGTCCLH
jgi:hypothetical protein